MTNFSVLDTSDLTQWGEYHCELSIGGDEKKEVESIDEITVPFLNSSRDSVVFVHDTEMKYNKNNNSVSISMLVLTLKNNSLTHYQIEIGFTGQV